MVQQHRDKTQECQEYARRAVRKALMKGLDRETAGATFMIEAISLIYEVDRELALEAASHANVRALESLSERVIHEAAAAGASEEELAALRVRKEVHCAGVRRSM